MNFIRFLSEKNSQTYTRAEYDAMVKAAAEKHGVPLNVMRHVIGTETGHLSPDKAATAVSNKGAYGVGQLMPAAIKDYNVKDPSDPRQSIDASARIMADHLKNYKGNIPQAFAAYNAGPGVVADYLNGTNKSGKNPNKRTTTDGIPPFKETQNYIKSFVPDNGSNVPDVSTRVADTAKTVATKSLVAATGSKSANAETPLKVQGEKMADATTQQSKDGMYQKHMPGAVVMPDWRGQPDEKAGLGPVILRPNGRWETLDGKRYINDPKFIDKINTTPASSNAGTSLERGDPQSFWDKTKRVLSGELASQVFGDDNPKQRQFQDARTKMWDEQDTIAKQTGGPISNVKMNPDGSWTGTDAKGKPVGGDGALKTQAAQTDGRKAEPSDKSVQSEIDRIQGLAGNKAVAQTPSPAPAAKTADAQSSKQTVGLGFGDPGYMPFVGNKVEKRSDGNWYYPAGNMPVTSNVAKHAETQLSQQNKGQNVAGSQQPPADQTAAARSTDTAKSVVDNTAAAATNSANAATQNKAAATPPAKAEPVAPVAADPVKPVSTPPAATTAEPKPGSWQEIAKLNNITDPTKLKAGSHIELPNGQGSYYVTKGDTLSGIAQRLNTTVDPQLNQPRPVNKTSVQPAVSNPAPAPAPVIPALDKTSIANAKVAAQYGTDQKDAQNRIDARTDQLARIEKNRNELPNTLDGASDRSGGNGTVSSTNEPTVDRLKTLAGNNKPISVSADNNPLALDKGDQLLPSNNKPNQTVSQPGDAGLIGNAFQMAQDANQKRTDDRAAVAAASPTDAKQMKLSYQRSIVNPEFMNDLTDPGPETVTPAKPVTSTAPVPVAAPQTTAGVTAKNPGVKSVEPVSQIKTTLNKIDDIQSSPPAAAAKEPANGNNSDSNITLPPVIATAKPEKINVWRDSSGKPITNRSGEPWGTGTSDKDDIDAAKIEQGQYLANKTSPVSVAAPQTRTASTNNTAVQPPPAASNSAVKITTPSAVAPTAAATTAAPAATTTAPAAAPAAAVTMKPLQDITIEPAKVAPADISPDSKQSTPPPKIPDKSELAPPVQGESISKGNRWSFISGLI